MPRQPRLDAPGTLHHVIGRGIERTQLFRNDPDRADFVARIATLATQGALAVYAWILMPNHVHLLVRTGPSPLFRSMKRLLTGYVVNFNRRYRRVGHLLQNRYKSIVVEDEPYLLEVTRYIHLNPLRGGLVADLAALRRYPWTGHATLLGGVARPWQDTQTILSQFGPTRRRATAAYQAFVAAGIPQGRRPDLVGGGLVRSLGGWAQVVARRRKDPPIASDPRILGSGEFTEHLLAAAALQEKETLRLGRKVVALAPLAQRISAETGIPEPEMRSGSRRPAVVRARRVLCQVAVHGMGYAGAAVARFLGVTTSSVNRLAASEELPEVRRYLNAL